ncbi:MAG: hypothetical protein HQL12_04680 [Candidatus Omnitrophica bacterium]|nr:hypothetical protein [Candidatus Omnitrophota bacterium]
MSRIPLIHILILVAFLINTFGPMPLAQAQGFRLPAPGSLVNVSAAYAPVMMKGLKVHPDNPLLFDFILDTGKSGFRINSTEFKAESQKLIKYFLAALTIKEDDLWVNLSPYEKDRMIPQELGQTEMGRDMLAQDYILKQLTASLIYPEKELGKKFWDNVYTKAREMYGVTNIPVNTFNKVWIVADKAKVLERNNVGYVVGSHLKVMLEEDYLSLEKHLAIGQLRNDVNKEHAMASQVVREIIIPELEKEVNQGENFALLRQMFYSMILASWYKLALKDALLNQVYSNKGKTGGVLSNDPAVKEKIYEQYLKAYKKGVFNYIKEDIDEGSKRLIPRKYFSGGWKVWDRKPSELIKRESKLEPGEDLAMSTDGDMAMVSANIQRYDTTEKLDSAMIMDGNVLGSLYTEGQRIREEVKIPLSVVPNEYKQLAEEMAVLVIEINRFLQTPSLDQDKILAQLEEAGKKGASEAHQLVKLFRSSLSFYNNQRLAPRIKKGAPFLLAVEYIRDHFDYYGGLSAQIKEMAAKNINLIDTFGSIDKDTIGQIIPDNVKSVINFIQSLLTSANEGAAQLLEARKTILNILESLAALPDEPQLADIIELKKTVLGNDEQARRNFTRMRVGIQHYQNYIPSQSLEYGYAHVADTALGMLKDSSEDLHVFGHFIVQAKKMVGPQKRPLKNEGTTNFVEEGESDLHNDFNREAKGPKGPEDGDFFVRTHETNDLHDLNVDAVLKSISEFETWLKENKFKEKIIRDQERLGGFSEYDVFLPGFSAQYKPNGRGGPGIPIRTEERRFISSNQKGENKFVIEFKLSYLRSYKWDDQMKTEVPSDTLVQYSIKLILKKDKSTNEDLFGWRPGDEIQYDKKNGRISQMRDNVLRTFSLNGETVIRSLIPGKLGGGVSKQGRNEEETMRRDLFLVLKQYAATADITGFGRKQKYGEAPTLYQFALVNDPYHQRCLILNASGAIIYSSAESGDIFPESVAYLPQKDVLRVNRKDGTRLILNRFGILEENGRLHTEVLGAHDPLYTDVLAYVFQELGKIKWNADRTARFVANMQKEFANLDQESLDGIVDKVHKFHEDILNVHNELEAIFKDRSPRAHARGYDSFELFMGIEPNDSEWYQKRVAFNLYGYLDANPMLGLVPHAVETLHIVYDDNGPDGGISESPMGFEFYISDESELRIHSIRTMPEMQRLSQKKYCDFDFDKLKAVLSRYQDGSRHSLLAPSQAPTHSPLRALPQSRSEYDEAMISKTRGGIDMNARNMGLDVFRDGQAIEMKFGPAILEQFRSGDFSGVVPVIINIRPMTNLKQFLGLKVQENSLTAS